MKKWIVTPLLLATSVAALAQYNPNRKLVWSEEFNYRGLPDSKIWGYEGLAIFVTKRHNTIRNGRKKMHV